MMQVNPDARRFAVGDVVQYTAAFQAVIYREPDDDERPINGVVVGFSACTQCGSASHLLVEWDGQDKPWTVHAGVVELYVARAVT